MRGFTPDLLLIGLGYLSHSRCDEFLIVVLKRTDLLAYLLFKVYRLIKSTIYFKIVDLVHLSSPRSMIDLVS